MANEKHLAVLRRGVEAWNSWVEERLTNERAFRADLAEAKLSRWVLSGANLSGADLRGAVLRGADLSGASLTRAHLLEAQLVGADLSRGLLGGADLRRADLRRAYLNEADLSGADLSRTALNGADLSRANLTNALVGLTVIVDVDLSTVTGLETVDHLGPSNIGTDTLYRSRGKIPEVFLRGAGVPGDLIAYIDSFICGKPIQFYSCFISYSSKDQEFAERLHADMQSKGLRVWYAPENLKWGDETREGIDRAIRQYDKLLVVLSETSINSAWVKKEVETAFEEEDRRKKLVLFPVRLDESVMETEKAWASDLRRVRNIGDFRCWKDHDAYQRAFERLLRDLKQEGDGGE